MYDLIGDIHGYAEPLKRLLTKMGYSEWGGLWQHPERKVIFLGDFIDRGPGQVEAVQIARTMVERGVALAVMGNHEFNAIAWSTPGPERIEHWLRPHTEKNRRQHQEFLAQVGEGSALHKEIVAWFKTLPLYLDLPGLRVVHACWHEESLRILQDYTDERGRIQDDAWPVLTHHATPAFNAVETVLKGLEIPLPGGHGFVDKDGNLRRNIRTRWWERSLFTYRDLAMAPPDVIAAIPHIPVPEDLMPGYSGDKPLFVGHYWLTGEPLPLSEHVACLDYSIAAQFDPLGGNGKLCAYRWMGEERIRKDGFVWEQ